MFYFNTKGSKSPASKLKVKWTFSINCSWFNSDNLQLLKFELPSISFKSLVNKQFN